MPSWPVVRFGHCVGGKGVVTVRPSPISSPQVSLPLYRPSPRALNARPKRLSVLGATGSIGDSTFAVVRAQPQAFDIVALVGGRNAKKMAALVIEFSPAVVAMADEDAARALRDLLPNNEAKPDIGGGRQAVLDASAMPADVTVGAITGFAGLEPVLAAIKAGNDIALANKESMVCAGTFVLSAAQQAQVDILPTDSEHSALFQGLLGQDLSSVSTLTLTASGGPFRALPPSELANVSVEQALAHPNWSMGSKVTIDSATMMNKGLELIEARWLFDMAPEHLDAVIHPQSIAHSIVGFHDGSFLVQMGTPTMVTPIAVALGWPQRLDLRAVEAAAAANDPAKAFANWSGLTFDAVDQNRFPCFALAQQAMSDGLWACIVLNAANELAVEAFLQGKMPFQGIADSVSRLLDQADRSKVANIASLEDVFAIDTWTRRSFAATFPS